MKPKKKLSRAETTALSEVELGAVRGGGEEPLPDASAPESPPILPLPPVFPARFPFPFPFGIPGLPF